MKEYLKHITEKVNVIISKDLRSPINPWHVMTNTSLIFEGQLEVSETSSSNTGQYKNASGNLQTYAKTSFTVRRFLLTLDFLASAEAHPVSPTSGTFSSSSQEPKTSTHWHRAEKDQAPYTSPIPLLQAPFTPAPKQQEHTTSILEAFTGQGLRLGFFSEINPGAVFWLLPSKITVLKKLSTLKKK